MRSVFGLVELDSGTVRWKGIPVQSGDRARFGYMPEERGLYPRMRVRDQLVYLGELGRGGRDTGRSVDRWLERLGLSARARDRVDTLSHGNQQRVQLIAALVNEPDLLILDEPFSGLDPLAITTMAGLLAELAAGGATVLFSSHQLDLVEDICEDVVIIDSGRIARSGDLRELRSSLPQRFVELRFVGAAPDLSRFQGVEIADRRDGQVRLRVGPGVDVPRLVATVGDAVELVSFSYRPPSLSELFRAAVVP
jgi:ABC-2 type transport system ATP-binding protein